MANSLYTGLAEVCHLFYKLYFPHQEIADIIDKQLKKFGCKRIAFFGGCIYVAEIVQKKGYDITYVEYTPEMMAQSKKVLRNMRFVLSDMRTLQLDEPHDAIVLMGRIFTYLHTDEDVQKTFNAFASNLKKGGIFIMDNYETGKIDADEYFNGTLESRDAEDVVRRISTMEQVQAQPALYRWDCTYEHLRLGTKESFDDHGHILRAFSKDEIKSLLKEGPLTFIEHAPNFEKRSFVTIAEKK